MCRLAACHRRFGSLSAVVVRIEVEERSVGFNNAVNRSTIAFSRRRNRRDAVLKVARRSFDSFVVRETDDLLGEVSPLSASNRRSNLTEESRERKEIGAALKTLKAVCNGYIFKLP